MYTKKTKIVATIGPVSEDEKTLERLIKHGVNVIRLNFSHGSFAEHGLRVKKVREISSRLDIPVAILQDLCGPKIRIGDFNEERVTLIAGKEFVLTTTEGVGDEHRVWVNYHNLPQEVKAGNIIFLDDGKKKLVVKRIEGNDIYCEVIIGGETKGRRGVNVPGAYLSLSSLTDKDKKDLEFGIEQGVDFMALSFVRRPEDVLELREILKQKKAGEIKIISKIETEEGIDNLDAILAVSDGVMVARGDLAIEIPAEQVPFAQKTIIKKCNRLGLPVITATQMLESMIKSPTPTRAEVNDVANAIFDGTDAVMLSEETTLGEHPVEAVDVMSRVAVQTEKHLDHEDFLANICADGHCRRSVADAFSEAAINVGHTIDASAIVVLSNSGFTARMISRLKPHRPLIVLTPQEKTYNQLALSYACYPLMERNFSSLSQVIEESKAMLIDKKLVKKNDRIIIVAGLPLGQSGATNTVIAETI
ncbi:MAG: pyruvate kinase [Candidatus Paceibacterota bacterium]|jgi:pyruvate kinase